MIPFVGPLAREGVKVTAGHLLDKYQTFQARKDRENLENVLDDLTRAFALELNQLTDTRMSLSTHRAKRRRLILCFDTFEQLGITDPIRIDTIWQLSRGLPLYLGLLTSNPQ